MFRMPNSNRCKLNLPNKVLGTENTHILLKQPETLNRLLLASPHFEDRTANVYPDDQEMESRVFYCQYIYMYGICTQGEVLLLTLPSQHSDKDPCTRFNCQGIGITKEYKLNGDKLASYTALTLATVNYNINVSLLRRAKERSVHVLFGTG